MGSITVKKLVMLKRNNHNKGGKCMIKKIVIAMLALSITTACAGPNNDNVNRTPVNDNFENQNNNLNRNIDRNNNINRDINRNNGNLNRDQINNNDGMNNNDNIVR